MRIITTILKTSCKIVVGLIGGLLLQAVVIIGFILLPLILTAILLIPTNRKVTSVEGLRVRKRGIIS